MSFILDTDTKCKKYQKSLPSFTPIVTGFKANNYSISLTGENFLPNRSTFVNFGSFKNIPITFFSSFNISFIIPLTATSGTYELVVVNIYNRNLYPRVFSSTIPTLNYSLPIIYTVE
jgi:hypothetical protein